MKSTYQLLLLDLFFSHCVSLPAEKKEEFYHAELGLELMRSPPHICH